LSETAILLTAIGTLVVALGTLITSIGGVLVSLRNTKKITEIHVATNGLAEKLGDAREAKGRAEGMQSTKPSETPSE
jgi:hypothetical protein